MDLIALHDVDRLLAALGQQGPISRRLEDIAERGARDWVVVFQRVRKEAKEDNVGLIAAGVAFWAILSIVPLLILAVILTIILLAIFLG